MRLLNISLLKFNKSVSASECKRVVSIGTRESFPVIQILELRFILERNKCTYLRTCSSISAIVFDGIFIRLSY